MAEDNNENPLDGNNNNPEATADEGGSGQVKDRGIRPPLQAIAVSTGVIAASAAAAAIKYLAG